MVGLGPRYDGNAIEGALCDCCNVSFADGTLHPAVVSTVDCGRLGSRSGRWSSILTKLLTDLAREEWMLGALLDPVAEAGS